MQSTLIGITEKYIREYRNSYKELCSAISTNKICKTAAYREIGKLNEMSRVLISIMGISSLDIKHFEQDILEELRLDYSEKELFGSVLEQLK